MKNEMDESGSVYRAAGAFRPGVLRRGTGGIATGLCLWSFTGHVRSFPVVSVMLPLAVYEQSTSPDLHDVRVFNQSGEPVPFSLVAATRPQATAQSTALRLFPLDASPLAAARRR
jgi:hypothetical protein